MGKREKLFMGDICIVRKGLTEECEKREVYDILTECDADFWPPLSKRGSTFQKSWEPRENAGVKSYFDEVAKQTTLLWKREGSTIAFLSFRTPYQCEELKGYENICYITTLCIRKKYRGRGLAPLIYGKAEKYIRETCPEAVMALRTWSTNRAQLHLMEELQFECVARLSDDRGKGIDTLYFAKIPEGE